MPQSNQRGIETFYLSDGLFDFLRPQSNQRGIETWNHGAIPKRKPPCLNRTSVGLKLHFRDEPGQIGPQPQSNQRGIETEMGRGAFSKVAVEASIEPAWD